MTSLPETPDKHKANLPGCPNTGADPDGGPDNVITPLNVGNSTHLSQAQGAEVGNITQSSHSCDTEVGNSAQSVRRWHAVSGYGQPSVFNATQTVSRARRLGYEVERPVWLSGEYSSGVLCSEAEYAQLAEAVAP